MQADGVKNIQSLKKYGWRKTNGKTIANIDLWKKVYRHLGLATNMGLHIHVMYVSADSVLWKKRKIWEQWWSNAAGIDKA